MFEITVKKEIIKPIPCFEGETCQRYLVTFTSDKSINKNNGTIKGSTVLQGSASEVEV